MNDRLTLRVGSLVIARRTTGVCDAGERGVCYERYTLDNRPGCSILFESGRHDGFNPDEVALILEVTGEVCPEVADYQFQSVMRLMSDYRRARFAPAFPPEHGA
jgi:hypothetical protein